MKKLSLQIKAKNKADEEARKLVRKIVDHDYTKYRGIVNAMAVARLKIKILYGVDVPDNLWDFILEEVVKLGNAR